MQADLLIRTHFADTAVIVLNGNGTKFLKQWGHLFERSSFCESTIGGRPITRYTVKNARVPKLLAFLEKSGLSYRFAEKEDRI